MSPCNKKNCCNNPSNKVAAEQPRAELSIPAVVEVGSKIVQQLRALMGTGIEFLPADISVAQLITTVQTLMLENSTLRSLMSRFGPPIVTVDPVRVTVVFGPNNDYTLQLAAGNPHERDLLAAQFRAAADNLVGPVVLPAHMTTAPDQAALPFFAED